MCKEVKYIMLANSFNILFKLTVRYILKVLYSNLVKEKHFTSYLTSLKLLGY
jgi:hypothetical protein